MNHSIPILSQHIDRWAECDAVDDAIADDLFSGRRDEERLRRSRDNVRLIAEADEILTRTLRIVDRLCPALPLPQFSTRYPELNSSFHYVMQHSDNARQRDRLHHQIKPRIAAKVRAS